MPLRIEVVDKSEGFSEVPRQIFQSVVNKELDMFLKLYMVRIFQRGINSWGQQMAKPQMRPKFAKNPKTGAKTEVKFRNAPPFLARTRALASSISIQADFSAGKAYLYIDYPSDTIGYIEERYGAVFDPQDQEIEKLVEDIRREIRRQIEERAASAFLSDLFS